MATTTITLTRDVTATPDDVWRVLTDVRGSADALSGVSAIEMLTDGPYRVGTRWRETRSIMGGAETEEMEVVEVDAPRHTVIRSEARGAVYHTVFTLEPAGDGSRLTMEFGGTAPEAGLVRRFLTAVPTRIGLMMMRKMMTRDLRDIASAAEGRATT
jgi:carbon monoxide dehydrogenase subunit G